MRTLISEAAGLGGFTIGGILTILLVAGGFSVANKAVHQSISTSALNQERAKRVQDQSRLLASLEHDLILQKEELNAQQDLIVRPVAQAKEMNSQIATLNATVTELQQQAAAARKDIEQIIAKKSHHRNSVRNKIWPLYLEKELKAAHLIHPLNYQDAKISKIDPAGIIIMHSSGAARLQVSELSPEFRKALALDLTEAQQSMATIIQQDARQKKRHLQGSSANKKPSSSEPAAQIDAALNQQLTQEIANAEKYLVLIRYAEETARTAHQNHRFSSSRSVPGKLESWAERARKFDKSALRYRQKFRATVAKIKAIDPDYKEPRL